MSTFLELAQLVNQDSGLASGVNPSTVTDQSGRDLKVVDWTAGAWITIQNYHTDWRWMRKEYSGKELSSGSAKYTAASFSLTDLEDWVRDDPRKHYHPHTIYLSATGVSDERALREISWQEWRTRYGRGTQTNNYPNVYAVSPTGELCYGPIPDATYTVGGEYKQIAQALTVDGSVPACPAAFHRAIVYQAQIDMAIYDEDPRKQVSAQFNLNEVMSALERSQLERIVISAAPLA